jgi:hypothetical protein
MGSRAVLIICKDEKVRNRQFGNRNEGIGFVIQEQEEIFSMTQK